MLLIAHNHHHTETQFIFSIFVTMSWYSSMMLFLCNLIFIFTLISNIINHIISLKQTWLFFSIFFRIFQISFGRYHRWRKWIIFKQPNFSLRVLLSICLIFCQFQPGVAHKNVADKKKRESRQNIRNNKHT